MSLDKKVALPSLINEMALIEKIFELLYHSDESISIESLKVLSCFTQTEILDQMKFLLEIGLDKVFEHFLKGDQKEK